MNITLEETRYPIPNFTEEEAIEKVRKAENAWNTKDPEVVATAYTLNSKWRNRNEFITGRQEIITLLTQKWEKEQHYKLIKELWAVKNNRIAVRFAYEWQDKSGQWFRSYGNENWQFSEKGLMEERYASINDLKIDESERKLLWKDGVRPLDYPSLSDLGL
ncbi:nuclear transport factor 2 family protein [Psychromonas sp. SP041]|uniref:nuclear transport factor 2 family protein n=1 Tax=Psychromonas sp. SP041 TaxID=1365007 RepID=UPI00041D6D9A|nr:nuclear transport factor 2 family protein [Psychromonas sp. SP041]